jgi:hypothetical protein
MQLISVFNRVKGKEMNEGKGRGMNDVGEV